MTDAVSLVPSLATGVVLGVIFFGGLWWTVRKGMSSTQPGLWFLGSLVLRVSVTLVGFYAASGGQWDRLLACLIGFTISRFIVTQLIGPPVERLNVLAKTAHHAPES